MMLTDISIEELSLWMPLIEDSASYVESLLKSDVDLEQYSGILASAASAYAYYKWCLITNNSDTKSFKAGDLSVSENIDKSSANEAYKLWQNSIEEISFLTDDKNFFFEGVSV
jgi:hypothetical protein